MRTRIARLTAASVLVLGLGALGAGPALAGDANPDGVGRGGGVSSVIILADDASPDVIILADDVSSVEDGAGAEWYLSEGGDTTTNGRMEAI